MSIYAPTHARAYAAISRKGAAVTFTRTTPGTYDPLTETTTPATITTIPGAAVRVEPRSMLDVDRYRALSLVESQAPTLLFCPTTFGSLPKAGDTVVWGGTTLTVRDVNPLEPDGTPIMAHVIVTA